ncbi:MAG: LysM peptidoglycan-binding domain-containing protein, partial [Desulfobacterales bacterium]|nr:LysM peptidoglycan-binding domain-containing protein [Desulfobacterales bacterium]
MKNKYFIQGIILFTLVIGCVLPVRKSSEKPTAPWEEKEKLIQSYLQKGQVYENKGNLVEASKQYKLALTVDARNLSAVEKNRRIENQLHVLAEKYYQEGLNFHKNGKYDLARRKFLMTLRHWPNHSGALEMIRPRKQIPAQNYLVHTIKAGESISQLAMLYYGDYHKFPIIAEYNNLKNATKVYVGQKIKVPQVEGLPFLVKKNDIKTEDVYPTVKPKKKETVKDEKKEPPVEIEEETRYRDLGIELFKKKEYLESTLELLKALNANPDDTTTREYLYQSNFNWAMELFEKKDYLT